ncbi:TetR/AcrR family transcriptional regulator [Trueperella pyogenes]|uniref:TetR/AcrR family transcriptional regulator n=1 Tax=Trueperella pyogenes TaxID=1661 RepID=UPI00043ADE92|nr:TetR/AcrR family transcriptional regulator [Trueperella pyogenes]AHU89812.1 AcrR family transcriptional regulator [Trueperella pyogenes]OQD36275.1 TetR family transcriptional regulator [Trueperella pyogenes]
MEEVRVRPRGQVTRGQIVQATRDLIQEEGLKRMSVSAIANKAGITRSLFYHHFANLDEVADAVLEQVIEEFVVELQNWNQQRTFGDVAGSLNQAAHLMRRLINEEAPFSAALFSGANAQLYVAFIDRMARRISAYIAQSTVRDFAAHHEIKIAHVENTFYMMLTGLVALIKAQPDISHEEIVQIAAQTLHLEEYLPHCTTEN